MKRINKLTLTLLILLFFAIAAIIILLEKNGEMYASIEAGVANEALIQHQRDFLLELPKLLRISHSKEGFVKLLEEKYPDTSVCLLGEDVCWMFLRLKFSDAFELIEIVEDENCIKER